MNKFILLLVLMLTSGVSKAAEYQINQNISTVSFATVKLEYVIEPALIGGLSGKISNSGQLHIEIPIANIETGIGIRNERLNRLFFQSDLFPSVGVSAQIPNALLTSELVVQQLTMPAKVSLFGQTQEFTFLVNVVKNGDTLSVASAKPVIVSASQFAIPANNLTELAKTVGQIPISATVPVSFSLIFSK